MSFPPADVLPQTGRVEWIGVRRTKGGPMEIVADVELSAAGGITGDRHGTSPTHRQVTLIQKEHLDAVAKLLRVEIVQPEQARRNLVVSGVNLLAFKGYAFSIGEAVLECTGDCPPCSRMEQTMGEGGFNAMLGHGGITATIRKSGRVAIHDPVARLERVDQ